MRTDVARRCPALGEHLIAADWAFVLHLAAHGQINRTRAGFTRFGLRGISSGSGAFSAFRTHRVEYLLPFRRLSGFVFDMARPFRMSEKVRLAIALARLTLLGRLRPGTRVAVTNAATIHGQATACVTRWRPAVQRRRTDPPDAIDDNVSAAKASEPGAVPRSRPCGNDSGAPLGGSRLVARDARDVRPCCEPACGACHAQQSAAPHTPVGGHRACGVAT